MNIIDIYNKIINKEPAVEKVSRCWKPTEAKDYGKIPKFTVPQKRKQKSTDKMLASALLFVDLIKHKRLCNKVTRMPISTSNKVYTRAFGNSMAVSRLINFMTDIGLISVANPKYRFNSKNASKNKSREYYYYYENEVALKEYCETHNVISVSHKSRGSASLFNRLGIGDFDHEKVRFNSKLKLRKLADYSKTEFEDVLRMCLYWNYLGFNQAQKMFKVINNTYYTDYPDLQLYFEPSFAWNKKNTMVTKIGIRATNGYCNAKKDKDSNPNFHGYYKQDVLDMYSLVFEKDVKSSVPRLTASINSGKWIPEKEDIYERIYKSYLRLKYPAGVPNDAISFDEARPAIKNLHMRCYFDYEGRIGPNTRRAMGTCKNKTAVDSEMKLLRQAVVDAEGGKIYDNEIFYYESVIYGRVLKQLLDEGFFVWLCYDAFYSTAKEGWDQEMFENYVQTLVEAYANELINEINKQKE